MVIWPAVSEASAGSSAAVTTLRPAVGRNSPKVSAYWPGTVRGSGSGPTAFCSAPTVWAEVGSAKASGLMSRASASS